MTDPRVCAVVVTYRPDGEALRAALAAVRPDVHALVVVDNASPGIEAALADADAVLLRQPRNVGLARAQNVGIDWAREHGCSHVLILDQDSVPAPGMVDALLGAWQDLSRTTRVGAVGPRFHDPCEDRDAPFVRVAFPMSHKLWCDATTRYVQSDFLISSGALIPLSVLDDVGGMDDALFIDNVDLEWSFRARSRATIARRCRAGGSRWCTARRGCTSSCVTGSRWYRRPHTPRVWLAQDLPRVLAKFVVFGVLVGPRGDNVRFMLRGVADGVRGRSGPCPLEITR